MRSFFSKIMRTYKTKRAPCDCRDFIDAVPEAPSVEHLRSVVSERYYARAAPAASEAEHEQRDVFVRSTVFDLKYRCGAQGRCTCEGAPRCRFPACFAMRPVTKGAEVRAERMNFEFAGEPSESARAIVAVAREERLEDAVEMIAQLVHVLVQTVAAGRPLDPRLTPENDSPMLVPVSSLQCTVNPLDENEELRDEVAALYLWRAALLVNLGRDDDAVNSLLNLADLLPLQERTRVYTAAVTWACLNDMEIIYYRSLVSQFERFPNADYFAHDRPILLPRVFDALKHDDYHTQLGAHIVFSKEVTATVSRAQAAQRDGDPTEDPMKSLCIPLSMPFYRFHVGDAFWQHFLSLLCMPPIPPPTPEEQAQRAPDPAEELGLTPSHILDAVGRSMMLHHLILYADARDKEIDTGVVAERVARAQRVNKAEGRKDAPLDRSLYDRVLENAAMAVCVQRMKQLLVVVRTYEDGQREAIESGRTAGGQKLGPAAAAAAADKAKAKPEGEEKPPAAEGRQ